jgi:hypothetical protein
MRREQIESAWRAVPFRPFKLILTNGTVHEVRHPELFMLVAGTVVIGYPDSTGQGGDRFAIIDLSHIAQIDRPTPPATPPAPADNGPAPGAAG